MWKVRKPAEPVSKSSRGFDCPAGGRGVAVRRCGSPHRPQGRAAPPPARPHLGARGSRASRSRPRSALVAEQLAEQRTALNLAERKQLTEDVLDELLGLGPLEPLLKDPTITDILVNGHANVFVERQGRLERTRAHFKDDRHLIRIIQKIVSAVGRRSTSPRRSSTPASPTVRASTPSCRRWRSTARCSIRKFAKIPINLSKLIEIGSVPAGGQVLEAIVRSRRNVVISGGTGSGKTTLLNAMSAFIDDRERIVTIEDLPSFSSSRTMSPGSRHGRRISRGAARSRNANLSKTRCACGPIGSSSARSVPARRSTCCRR